MSWAWAHTSEELKRQQSLMTDLAYKVMRNYMKRQREAYRQGAAKTKANREEEKREAKRGL